MGVGHEGASTARTDPGAGSRGASTPHPDTDTSAREVTSLILSGLLDTVVTRGAEAQESLGVEEVHRLRVAIRRLRALCDFLEPGGGEPLEHARHVMRPLARRLGGVRDLDVLVEHLDAGGFRVADPSGTRAVLRDHREHLAGRVSAFLAGPAWPRALARVEADLALVGGGVSSAGRSEQRAPDLPAADPTAADLPTADPTAADLPAADLPASDPQAAVVLDDLLSREWRRFGKRLADLPRMSAHRRHRVRIRAKRLRYAMEVCDPHLGGDRQAREQRARRLDDLEALQDELGALNDRTVAREILDSHGLGLLLDTPGTVGSDIPDVEDPRPSRAPGDGGHLARAVEIARRLRLDGAATPGEEQS